MSADFCAAYISGVLSLLVGSPLDIVKVRYQAYRHPAAPPPPATAATPLVHAPAPPAAAYYAFPTARSLLRGTAAPILGLGALNGLLYWSYNRALRQLDARDAAPASASSGISIARLANVWLAGALGGLATWLVSAPTELVKCRAQLAPHASSRAIARALLRAHGLRGLYIGGAVTAVRDSVGYGFYFAAYEAAAATLLPGAPVARSLLAGGIGGVATWASVYPLDVVKTRVQTQGEVRGPGRKWHGGYGAWEVARRAWREGGARVFVDGLGVCLARAFVVNAVQWAAYEYIMRKVRERDQAAAGALMV